MSNDLFNLPSLVIACIFGALAIFMTLVGICKAVSLISSPQTPDLLQDAHVSLSILKRNRFAGLRPKRAARTRNSSPPRLPLSSGQPPVKTELFTPFLRPVVLREAQNPPWKKIGLSPADQTLNCNLSDLRPPQAQGNKLLQQAFTNRFTNN